MAKEFIARPPEAGPVPLLIGLEGPPGGGKTCSAFRLATGMQRARKGPIVVIDTEAGRAKKFAADFTFDYVDLSPPFKPLRFWEAIATQLELNPAPAAIVVDSMSDEHEGEGGVLEWHDDLVKAKTFGDNSQYAWGPPKAERKRLIGRILRVKVPLIFTFRAREKTRQEDDPDRRGKKRVVDLGWVGVAPLEILHALDLVCLLPSRANGVPVWRSDKAGEGFIVKLPDHLVQHVKSGQLNEETGEGLARWAGGGWSSQGKSLGAASEVERQDLLQEVGSLLTGRWPSGSKADKAARGQAIVWAFQVAAGNAWEKVKELPLDRVRSGLDALQRMLEGNPVGRELDDEDAAALEAEQERLALQVG